MIINWQVTYLPKSHNIWNVDLHVIICDVDLADVNVEFLENSLTYHAKVLSHLVICYDGKHIVTKDINRPNRLSLQGIQKFLAFSDKGKYNRDMPSRHK